MDDIDQGVAPPSASVPSHFETFIDVVNNKPLPVEKADVSLKGRINAMPLLVTYCTNYHGANLLGRCLDPEPFWRRIKMYVDVRVRPEYASASGGLDIDKATAA